MCKIKVIKNLLVIIGIFAAIIASSFLNIIKVKCENNNLNWEVSQKILVFEGEEKRKALYIKDFDEKKDYKFEFSNPNIAQVSFRKRNKDSYLFYIDKKGVGESFLNIIDSFGQAKIIKIISKPCEFQIEKNKIVFDKKHNAYADYINITLLNAEQENYLKKIEIIDSKMIKAKINPDKKSLWIKIIGFGMARIKLYDSFNRSKLFSIHVKKSWQKAYFKNKSQAIAYYENKYLDIYSLKNAKLKLEVSGKRIKRKVGKSGFVRIYLKKHLKYKEKIRLIFAYKSIKIKKSIRVKTKADLMFKKVWSNKKYIPLLVKNMMKDNIIILKAGRERYIRKINKSKKRKYMEFYLDKNISQYASIKVKIINKYKQLLYKYSWHFNW